MFIVTSETHMQIQSIILTTITTTTATTTTTTINVAWEAFVYRISPSYDKIYLSMYLGHFLQFWGVADNTLEKSILTTIKAAVNNNKNNIDDNINLFFFLFLTQGNFPMSSKLYKLKSFKFVKIPFQPIIFNTSSSSLSIM